VLTDFVINSLITMHLHTKDSRHYQHYSLGGDGFKPCS
jgi:hypothetical protein